MDLFIPVEAEGYTSTDWQEEDLANLVERSYSANWSEMGCYKTTTGLWLGERIIERLGDLNFAPNMLCITSRNGKGTYYDALPKTLGLNGWRYFDVSVSGGVVTERLHDLKINRWEIGPWTDYIKESGDPYFLLAHYHCFTNNSPVRQWLNRLDYLYGIVDEAHKIKNKDGQWTRHIKKLGIMHKHIMTGSGFVNHPEDIWSLLNFLDPERWSSIRAFKDHFCDEVESNGYTIVTGLKRETRQEFRELVRELGPRREMRQVHKNIKEPLIVKREVDLNPTQRAMYDQLRLELYALDQKGVAIYAPNVLALLNRLRQVTIATPEKTADYYDEAKQKRVQEIHLVEPSSKLDELMDLLEELRWDDEVKNKVVVFSQFKDPLFLLEKRLETKKIPYLHMEAHHNDEQRYKMWHDLWPQPYHQVFLATLDLGGESINLTPGQYCVFLDRSWSPRANNQAVGRVYRPGQTEACEMIYINARRTTDQRVEQANNRKTGWFKEIFGDEVPE